MKPRSEESFRAVRRGHKRLAVATLRTPAGIVGNVPIHRGSVTFSLSKGDGVRSGTIFTPGYALWTALDPGTNCWIDLTISVDGEQFVLGEFPVLRVLETRPGSGLEVTLGDWAYRRVRAKAQNADNWLLTGAGVTVAQMVATHLEHVIGEVVTCTTDDTFGALMPTEVKVASGANVYAAMEQVASSVGAIIVTKSRTTFELRKFDPNVPYHEEITGTVSNSQRWVDAEVAVNRVVVAVDSEDPEGSTFRSVRTLTTGPYAWDAAKFGYAPIVETLRLPTSSQAIADGEANRLYDRRVGVLVGGELEVIPQPWLEVGDVIVNRIDDTRIDQAMINAITHPLTSVNLARIVTRSVGVA